MNTATRSPEPLEYPQEVTRLLRTMPRERAPRALTTSMRRALSRERRQAPMETTFPLWPAAAAVQLALLVVLCALYLFATPPTAVVKASRALPADSATDRGEPSGTTHNAAGREYVGPNTMTP